MRPDDICMVRRMDMEFYNFLVIEQSYATPRSAGIPARIDSHIAVRMTALRT